MRISATNLIASRHPVEPAVRERVTAELAQIEARHDVAVLFAVESGSRGWGFASPNSDYDVRFVYAHRLPWYLTVKPGRDVIEVPISDELDVSGWELRKALGLLRDSNPVLIEWLRSPIRYLAREPWTEELAALATQFFAPIRGHHHYVSMAKTACQKILGREQVRLKRYLYAIRALLAARWVRQGWGAPPMVFADLVHASISDAALLAEIDALVARKVNAVETSEGPGIAVLDSFLTAELAAAQAHQPEVLEHRDTRVLDDFLYRAVAG